MSDLKHIERQSTVCAVRLPNELNGRLEAAVAGGRNTKSGFIRALLEQHFYPLGEQPAPARKRIEMVDESDWSTLT